MAEVMGIMLRRKPKQVFTIFVSWNLSALGKRIKRLQWPWASYPPNRNLISELPMETAIEIPRHNEEYLRPTSEINPYAPEIVALAMKLGLKEKSKREFAEAAYNWVKNNINTYMETPARGPIHVLKRGYGLCINKMSVFVALMRLAGIPARFVTYKQEMPGGFMQVMAEEMMGNMGQEIVQEIQKTRMTFTHGCVELFLDGEWVPADLTWTEEEEVGFDIPITQFGESPFGKWYYVMPDSISKSESLPWRTIRFFMGIQVFILRGLFDRVNERFNQIRETGRKKLEEMGREAYIESKKKFYVPMPHLRSKD